ncbi:MAG: PEP-CTERM sorting domain-containing protein, partial [Planctomycetota bacterium]
IEPGEFLAEILLLEYDDPDTAGVNDGNRGFHALFDGDVAALPAFGNNLGGNHLDPLAFGTDLLPGLAGGGISGGTGIPGGVLGPGTYTYLIQQTGPQTSDYLVDLVVVPEPAALSMLTLGAVAVLRRRRA